MFAGITYFGFQIVLEDSKLAYNLGHSLTAKILINSHYTIFHFADKWETLAGQTKCRMWV
jgi:hypothetical protein